MAIILLVAFGPPALFALSIARAKRYRQEPGHAVFKAFMWGAIFAAGISLFLNTTVSGRLVRPYLQHDGLNELALALVVAPIVEEAAKALGIVAVASVRRHTDEVADGIIYGAAIGLGFSATENLFYELTALGAGGQTAYIMTAIARTFSSSLLHATATAITGYGMARWLSGKSRFGPFAVIPWYLLAVILHSAFNAVAIAAVWITIIPLMILGIVAFAKVRKRVTELSMVAPHKRWKPVGRSRPFRRDEDGAVAPVWAPPGRHEPPPADKEPERWYPESPGRR